MRAQELIESSGAVLVSFVIIEQLSKGIIADVCCFWWETFDNYRQILIDWPFPLLTAQNGFKWIGEECINGS